MTGAPGAFGALHHIGIVVPDLDVVSSNIEHLLEGRVIEEGADEALAGRFQWIESAGNPIIELVAPTGDGPIADDLVRRGQGLHHLSFWPASFDASLGHVRACGFEILGEDHDHAGHEEFFVHPSRTGGALMHSFRALADT